MMESIDAFFMEFGDRQQAEADSRIKPVRFSRT
jgi:hypothetical protein